MPRQSNFFCFGMLLLTLTSAGCSPYIRMPNFAQPGTAAQQRADAERFDPYPDPDAGPEVVGGRPPGFTRPLTQEEWAERYAPRRGALQPAAIPSLPGAPVFTNPFPPSTATTFTPPPAFTSPVVPTSPIHVQPRAPY
jgi:hypothetical protein